MAEGEGEADLTGFISVRNVAQLPHKMNTPLPRHYSRFGGVMFGAECTLFFAQEG